MKLDKILEYQKVNQQLTEKQAVVLESEEAKRYNVAKKRRSEAQAMVAKMTSSASELLQSYAPIKKKLDELKDELEGFDGVQLDDVQDMGEADNYLKRIAIIAEELSRLEKTAANLSSQIDKLTDASKKLSAQYAQLEKEFARADAEARAKIAEAQPEIEEIKKKLNALAAEIDPALIKLYLSHKQALNNKPVVFVKYNADSKSPNAGFCTGCGVELPGAVKTVLRAGGDYAECPNCHRILYVSES